MKNLLFTFLLSLVLFTGVAIAQPPPPPPSSNSSGDSKIKADFLSLDGGFTIALPAQISSFSGIKPVEGVNKGGSQFTWQIPQGFYLIGFADRIFSPESYKRVLQQTAQGTISDITANGGKLISKTDISLDGNAGIEIKMQADENTIGFARFYLVKDRIYILTTGWKTNEDGKQQINTLDSFKLIDKQAILAKKVADATPQALPQLPTVKKTRTDAEDEQLKGKVKSVTESKEDLTGTWSISGLKTDSEDFYNENGNQIKHIYYDYRGNPMDITVFGFIDGMRVSKSGSVRYEYNPPAMAMPPSAGSPKPVKPSDNRYTTHYEYKYDERGRLAERTSYRNNGEMTGKSIYIYEGNKLTRTFQNSEGKITSQIIQVFDDKGNMIEQTFPSLDSKYGESKYTYTYLTFDDKGNWTKRVILGKEGQYNGGTKDQNYIEYRTITYYN